MKKKPRKTKVGVLLTQSERRMLKEHARQHGRTVAQHLREIIRMAAGADSF